jgi:hypothetical protein
MGYQNVSTPRFYIDQFSYLLASNQVDNSYYDGHTGIDKNVFSYPGLIGLNPTSQFILTDADYFSFDIPTNFNTATPIGNKTAYVAVLGHNLEAIGMRVFTEWHDGDGTKPGIAENEIVNLHGATDYYPSFDGYTLYKFTTEPSSSETSRFLRLVFHKAGAWSGLSLSSLSWGFAYDMPVAPDLSLSLEHDYSGITKATSISGASFSNANWIKPPKWGDLEAWQLKYQYYNHYRDFPRMYSGRRVWDLSFSYISDSDLEPRNYTGTGEFDLNDTNYVLSEANWFEDVLHSTMGGHLPFIFQPDGGATYETTSVIYADGYDDVINEIPEFAICRFDMDTFSREQVAPGVYNIKIKVKETW